MKTPSTITDWTNIDLDSPYQRDLNIIDPYDFNTLLLEVHCNIKEINEKTVREQFEESLQSKIESARNVFNANLANIVKKAKEERKG